MAAVLHRTFLLKQTNLMGKVLYRWNHCCLRYFSLSIFHMKDIQTILISSSTTHPPILVTVQESGWEQHRQPAMADTNSNGHLLPVSLTLLRTQPCSYFSSAYSSRSSVKAKTIYQISYFQTGNGKSAKKHVSELVLKNVSVKWQANKKILNSEPTVADIPSPGSIFFNHYWELSAKHHTPLCKKLRQLRKLEGSRINLIQHKNNYKKLILGTLDLVRQSQVSK